MTLRRIMRAIHDIPAVNPLIGTETGEGEDASQKPPPPPASGPDRYGSLEIPASL